MTPKGPETGTPCHRLEIDRLVRREHGRLVAWLVRRLGSAQLPLAEDVAQEALVEALDRWPWQGMPEQPAAWLRTVARNRAIDRLRKTQRETEWVPDDTAHPDARADDVFAARVPDEALRLVFLCCHPELSEADQLALILKIVGGFTARDTARLMLKPETTISQRLARAKRALRAAGEAVAEEPTPFDIRARLATAEKVLHLAFSHGYAPRSGDQVIRKEVCAWTLGLARELAGDELTGSGSARALAALLCFQASRLGARQDEQGLPVLLRDQDRDTWDAALVEEGLGWLQQARTGPVSRYHLEAGIASLHATAADWAATDWQAMLGLYERLEVMTGSPVVTLNAAVVRAELGELEGALARLDALADTPGIEGYAPWHVARADLLRRLGRDTDAKQALEHAATAGLAGPVAAFLASA